MLSEGKIGEGSMLLNESKELSQIIATYLLEKKNKLNDKTGETVDTGNEVAKTDEGRRVGKSEEEQSNSVEPP